MKNNKPMVIFTGTDPESKAGGIGFAMKGYFNALDSVGIQYEAVPTFRPGSFFGRFFLWLSALPELGGKIRQARRNGLCPVVYSQAGHGFSLFREFFVLSLARLAGAKTILHIHAPQVYHYFDKIIPSVLIRISLFPANRVFVLTEWWKAFLDRHRLMPDKIVVVYNPLPPDLEKTASSTCKWPKSPKKDTDVVSVLTMARLAPGKGVDVAIKAMAILPENVKLIVAGDGSERNKLEELSQKLNVRCRVVFKGWVSGMEKIDLLEKADIFCLPSTNDAYPISLVEAMCYGIPVIGVRYAGIPDIVCDGKVGYLVEKPDELLVAKAIKKLFLGQTRRVMGDAAKPWIMDKSSPRTIGEKIARHLSELVE